MSDHNDDKHDHGHDDHGHGHIQLQYQPALPLPNGKVCLWLFLSTEIMFFAGLLGTYIVLRFGAPVWPSTHDVHLAEPIGAGNTFVLILSSFTVVLALEAAKKGKTSSAKIYLAVTLALGALFLVVKAYEYNAKFAHGIYPQHPHSLIYDKSDVNYLAAVRNTLEEKRDELVAKEKQLLADKTGDEPPTEAVETIEATDTQPATPAVSLLSEVEQSRLNTCHTLINGLVRWTQLRTAEAPIAPETDSLAAKTDALAALAAQIYPTHHSVEMSAALLAEEQAELTQERDGFAATVRQLERSTRSSNSSRYCLRRVAAKDG